MVTLRRLLRYTDDLLRVSAFRDYCPNGLQVEGRAEIRSLVSGVTASQALLEAAIAAGADAVLVHHGYFWKGEAPEVIGMKRRRLALLLAHDINLLAYHLPLDAHPELGNNAELGRRLGLLVDAPNAADSGTDSELIWRGRLPAPMSGTELAAHLTDVLQRPPLHVPGPAAAIETVAWCTGAAQGYLEQAVALGVDAYITGEVSEPTVHTAREQGIHFFAAGHHATERYGVQALGAHLAAQFELEHQFIDIDNPV